MTYAVIAFFATIAISLAAPDKAAIEAKEKAAWQAFKDKKADDFKKVVDKDLRCVYAEGLSDMQKELADMQKWDMKSFAISDFTAFSDEPLRARMTARTCPAPTMPALCGSRRRVRGWRSSTPT